MTYVPPPHVTQNWQVTKPGASGRRGMVASQSRDAALAGVAALDAGGNAVDAAVATALALAAVEPWNSGLGGIGFAVVHRAGQARAEVVDFGPRAPRGLDASAFRLTGGTTRDLFSWPAVEGDANIHGPLSFVVPSAVAGYAEMHERWGRLPLDRLMAPAVALARRGLAQDWYTTLKVAHSASILRRYEESARIYLPDGLPPVAPYQGTPGFFALGHLADTLARLSERGLRDFYDGDLAATIAEDVARMGGVLTLDDLRRCRAEVRPAREVAWRGRVWQMAGGLTAAPTLARVMETLRGVDYGAAPDAAWFAALATAMTSAYAERLSGLGEDAGGPGSGDGEPQAAQSCTSHLTACDEEGTMVSMTTTLLSSMGSRVVLPRSGVLMNNGVMWFDPSPGRPNSVAPGRRPPDEHVPGGGAGGRRPRPGRRCLGGPPYHGGGVPDPHLRVRFRHGAGGGGPSSADRRVGGRPRHRRRPASRGRRRGAAGGGRGGMRRACRDAAELRLPQPDRAGPARHRAGPGRGDRRHVPVVGRRRPGRTRVRRSLSRRGRAGPGP